MEINFLNSRGYAATIHYAQASMYDLVAEGAKKSGWVRLSAPLVALSSSILKAAQRVFTVAETVIKGLANIFAFPFTDKCEFLAGLNQLFIKLPMDVFALMFAPAEIAVGAVITTGGILFEPVEYAEFRQLLHEMAYEAFEKDGAKDVSNLQMYSTFSTFLFG